MLECIEQNHFAILYDGPATRVTCSQERASSPDISFCSAKIGAEFSWKILDKCGMSDHIPILIRFNIDQPDISATLILQKYGMKSAN